MNYLKAETPLDVLKHLFLIALVGLLLVLGFFYVYLPVSTHHGETITVPKVTGMNVADLEKYLNERNLAYLWTTPATALISGPSPCWCRTPRRAKR